MKRLYVRDAARGTGAGRALAEAAVAEGKRMGYAGMRLDTLSTMAAALSLYRALGFKEIPAYYDTPIDRHRLHAQGPGDMSETVEPLLVDLVEFVAREERPYLEVMDAWRTSCPRLPVWEEANARGLVTRVRGDRGEWLVCATAKGAIVLEQTRT